jgi:hypothetical protein
MDGVLASLTLDELKVVGGNLGITIVDKPAGTRAVAAEIARRMLMKGGSGMLDGSKAVAQKLRYQLTLRLLELLRPLWISLEHTARPDPRTSTPP